MRWVEVNSGAYYAWRPTTDIVFTYISRVCVSVLYSTHNICRWEKWNAIWYYAEITSVNSELHIASTFRVYLVCIIETTKNRQEQIAIIFIDSVSSFVVWLESSGWCYVYSLHYQLSIDHCTEINWFFNSVAFSDLHSVCLLKIWIEIIGNCYFVSGMKM